MIKVSTIFTEKIPEKTVNTLRDDNGEWLAKY